MKPASTAAAVGMATAGIALFATMDAVMKQLSIELGAYNAMLWRSIIGIGIGAILFVVLRKSWPTGPVLRIHIERGIAGGASVLLFFWGLKYVPLAQGVALSFIAPLIALYLAAVLLKERVGKGAVFASLVAFAGVLVILGGQARADLGPEAFRGALAILAAAVLYAYNLVLMRRQSQVAGPIEVALFLNLVAGGLYAFGAPWLLEVPDVAMFPRLFLASALAFVSLMLLSWAYARAEAQQLLPVEYTAFVWAALLGWWMFGEAVSPLTIVGTLMIVAGCIIAARKRADIISPAEAAL